MFSFFLLLSYAALEFPALYEPVDARTRAEMLAVEEDAAERAAERVAGERLRSREMAAAEDGMAAAAVTAAALVDVAEVVEEDDGAAPVYAAVRDRALPAPPSLHEAPFTLDPDHFK